MMLAVVGLSHKTSSLEVRERLAFKEEALRSLLTQFHLELGIEEIVGLVTCNRTEFYFAAPEASIVAGKLKERLMNLADRGALSGPDPLYAHIDEGAARHLFRVASTLDSLVVGEAQILGQVKEAYARSVDHGFCGPHLNKLFQKAFTVAKKIRSETEIGTGAVSIPSVAVELARKIFGGFETKGILLLGSGEVARLALKGFQEYGANRFIVTSRTLEKAKEMAAPIGATAIPLELLSQGLEDADIILASLDARETVVTAEQVHAAMGRRRHRPMFFVDVAVPRNIAPEVNEIFNVYLYHIDDLKMIAEEHLLLRAAEAHKAEEIVTAETAAFMQEMGMLTLSPAIRLLTEKFDQIRKSEVVKALAKMNGAGPGQKEILEACTTAIVQKILHEPLVRLKSETVHEGGGRAVEFLKKLFGL